MCACPARLKHLAVLPPPPPHTHTNFCAALFNLRPARALAEFAAGLAADPSGFLPLWTGDTHPCGDASNNFRAWPGLVCDAPGGHVTAIALRSKGLAGRLPDGLSVLKSVRSLDLSNNSFEGSIPGSWSNLTSLESADLSRNALTGPLPPSFASLVAIQTLDVHSNNLTGSLPATWASMSMLEVCTHRVWHAQPSTAQHSTAHEDMPAALPLYAAPPAHNLA